MIHKITCLLLQNKVLIQQSLSECPASFSYHLSQALSFSSSITPLPISLPCKETRTSFRKLALFSPYLLKMFICLVQATTHTSILSLTCQPTWRWALEDSGQGDWALLAHTVWDIHRTLYCEQSFDCLHLVLSAFCSMTWGWFAKSLVCN